MSSIPFAALALASRRVATTRSRLQKQRFIVDVLTRVPKNEVAAAVGWLIEEPVCGRLGVGPAQLWELSLTRPPDQGSVTLREVEDDLAEAHRAPRKETLGRVRALFERLTEPERALFVGALTGSLRQGSLAGIYVFDCMHRNGVDLVDQPLAARLEALRAAVPGELLMPQLRTKSPDEAARFRADAQARGHEGVMVKDLSSPYSLGSRGRAWQKVKEFSTVDLVVLAAEWGSGRRRGFLSNLHLGARRDDGSFCMVGKTFKGLTDATLRWQTARLEQLATERTGHLTTVRPELVVEIRFNDVQRSRRYPGGIALRFARVVRYREDKAASEVEPLHALIARLPEPLVSEAVGHRVARGGKKTAKKRQLSLFED